jgi:hypothetical protein
MNSRWALSYMEVINMRLVILQIININICYFFLIIYKYSIVIWIWICYVHVDVYVDLFLFFYFFRLPFFVVACKPWVKILKTIWK